MVKNIIFLTLIFIMSGCGMMGSSSKKDTSLANSSSDNSVASTDLNSTDTSSGLIADNTIDSTPTTEPTTEPTTQEESILPQTISIDFPDVLKQDKSIDNNITNEINNTIEDVENNNSNTTITSIGYEQLKKNISRIEDVVKIAQVNLILLEKVMPQVLDKCEGMISCTFEPKFLSIILDNETISKIDEIINDSNFSIVDKNSRVSLGEVAFTKKSVDEGYDYELKLDMLSDSIPLNNLYKDANRSDINQTDINISNDNILNIDVNLTDNNLTKNDNNLSDINVTYIDLSNDTSDNNRVDINTTDINTSSDNNSSDINITANSTINSDINTTDINSTDKNITLKEFQVFKWSDYNSDVITTYVYDNNESIINISIYYLVDEYGKATMHVYNTNNKEGHKENMNLTLSNKEEDNSTLLLQANSIEQTFDGNETNISSFSSNGEISDKNSQLLFSDNSSNQNLDNNTTNTSEVVCDNNISCTQSSEIMSNIEFYQLKITDGNLTDGSFVLLPPYSDINGLKLIDIFGLTLGTFTIFEGKAQGEIHNGSYNDMLDRLTIVEINNSENNSTTMFKLIDSKNRPNIEIIEQ